MAESVGMSHSTIGRIWRAFGLKPHRTRSFRLSQDPQLVEKIRDTVGLYMSPPDNAVVVCVDAHNEKPKPFRWTKSADEILASIARFATRRSQAHRGER